MGLPTIASAGVLPTRYFSAHARICSGVVSRRPSRKICRLSSSIRLVNSDAPRDWGASGASIALNALSHASSRISWVRLPSVAAHSAAFWKVSTVAVVLGSR